MSPRRTHRTAPPRARGLLDSWALALTVAAAIHAGAALTALPRSEPVGEPSIPSFTLLPGAAVPGGLADFGDDEGADLAQDELPRIATAAPTQLVEPIQPEDLPEGGTMPVKLADRSAERASLLEELDREQRLRAALEAARPPGAGGEGDTRARGGGGQGGDIELYRWSQDVEALFREAFHPITRIDDERVAWYIVRFDPRTGVVEGFERHRSSGDATYDGAVERAIRSVPRIPPPPEHLAAQVGRRLLIDFHPP